MDFLGFAKKKKHKGQIQGLPTSAMLLGGTVIILAFLALILSQIQTQVVSVAGANSVADNITTSGLEALAQYGTWLVIIAIVILAVVVIQLFMGGFGGLFGGQRR